MNLLLSIAFCGNILRVDRLLYVVLAITWLLDDLRGLNASLVLLQGLYLPLVIDELTLWSHTLALIYHHRLLTLRWGIGLIKLRVVILLSIGNLAILGLHYLHLLEEHLDAVLLFEEVKLAWVLKAVNFLLLREILLGKRWSLSNFKERRHFFVLYLIRGSNWSCMRAHCTILEQGLGFLDKLSQLVIGDVGIKWSDGTTLGSHVGHFLS